MIRRLELTLAMIKPHVCNDPISLMQIRSIILENKLLFIRSKNMRMKKIDAEKFYEEHRGKFFYDRLVSLMTSGDCWIHILAGDQAISRWRKLMGPTKVFKTSIDHPETIRAQFGLTDTRNATHGSDSIETSRKEILFFFPEFQLEKWFENQEPRFRKLLLSGQKTNQMDQEEEQIIFNETKLIHEIVNKK